MLRIPTVHKSGHVQLWLIRSEPSWGDQGPTSYIVPWAPRALIWPTDRQTHTDHATSVTKLNRHTNILWTIQDVARHHRRWNTGWTALAIYKHDWAFSKPLPLKHFLCPHSTFPGKSVALARRTLWRLGAHAINNNNSSSNNYKTLPFSSRYRAVVCSSSLPAISPWTRRKRTLGIRSKFQHFGQSEVTQQHFVCILYRSTVDHPRITTGIAPIVFYIRKFVTNAIVYIYWYFQLVLGSLSVKQVHNHFKFSEAEKIYEPRERGLYVQWSFSLRFLFSYFSATTGSVSRNYSIDAARSRTVCGAPSRVCSCVTVDRESVYSCLFHRSTTAAACGGFAAERPAGNI